jgi:hypothetical protein
VTRAADAWGRNARIVPLVDVDPNPNGYATATTAREAALGSGAEARVRRTGDDGAGRTTRTRSAGAGAVVDAVGRRTPDLDRFTAALLALALHELDQERNGD